ncbi:TonB family protein [Aliiroseovarius sp. YM-037]|uniref:TonB family protein n=1 Tax=Aliiroseovarius sp. YM-037 TaxID=3341728 RepID=UPI003A7F74CD
MTRIAEALLFLTLAVGLHVGAWFHAPVGVAEGSGAGGDAALSLEAADAAMAAMVASWEEVPEVSEAVSQTVSAPEPLDAIAQPDRPPAEVTAPRTNAPSVALPTAENTAPPAITTTPATRPTVEAKRPDTTTARPQPRPEAPAEQPRQAAFGPANSTPQSAERAEGQGNGTARGQNAQAEVATLSSGQRRALLANWGATIRARIERRKPRVSGRGTAMVRIVVGRDGRVQGVGLAQSSGDGGLDRAAIRAVQRAGRFPPAPRQLTDVRYTFDLPVRFQ